MPKAIVIREYGGSDVLKVEDVPVESPGPNEILIRQTAIGVHFHDIYVRSGLYKTLSLPGILNPTAVIFLFTKCSRCCARCAEGRCA